jgi:ABC-type dipeptide/oligopeptide/nickel transport system permease subunit
MVILIALAVTAIAVAVGTPLGIAGYYEYQRRKPTDWANEPVVPWS